MLFENMKTLTIATAHSSNLKKDDIIMTIKLEGGSPYLSHIWINDEIYTISLTQTDKSDKVKIEKTK